MEIRDEAIQIICSNLIMAEVLLPDKTAKQMGLLYQADDISLGLRLVESRHLLDMALQMRMIRNKN